MLKIPFIRRDRKQKNAGRTKVSVVVPVYNAEHFLRPCLDSLCSQTLQEKVIICVDDGSTDTSLSILEEYEARYDFIKVYEQAHRFAGIARNHGMRHASGEYLLFLDADDFFEPELLELGYLDAKRFDSDLVLINGNRFNNKTQRFYEEPLFDRKKFPDQRPFSAHDSPLLLFRTRAGAGTKLCRREFIEAMGLRFQGTQNYNDMFFSHVAVSMAARITYIDRILVHQRGNHPYGIRKRERLQPVCLVEVLVDIANYLKRRGRLDLVEQGLINAGVWNCLRYLNTNKGTEKGDELFTLLLESPAQELHLLDRSDGYYIEGALEKKQRLVELLSEYQEQHLL